jgi:hypothetical protein
MLWQHTQMNDESLATWSGNETMLPIDAIPINGFVPQVVFGLTDEQKGSSTQDFFAARKSSPGGFTLPKSQTVRYDVAILDSGSQSHLITANAYSSLGFNIPSSGREGTNFSQVAGASGIEDVGVTDALGVYATGINNANVSGGVLGITPGSLRGQYNTSILGAQPGSALPNIIGAPIIAQYQTVISNSQTRHITLGNGTVVRSPSIAFQTLNTAAPSNYSRLTLDVMSVNGVTPDPAFLPDPLSVLIGNGNLANNPTAPTFWGSMLAKVGGNNGSGSISNEQFLFDTGAQVTVVSQDTAASLGYYSAGENPSTPDFTVEVSGVGGSTTEVPGFYVNNLNVMTNGGPISWSHVPVIVLDIPDPRDAVGFIPGVLGMNLFTDRALVLNGGFDNPYVAISPKIAAQWTAVGGGTWSDDVKWSLGSPDNADTPANFLSSITNDATITVDSQGFTVGSMKFDNAHRYTIAGPGTINFVAQSMGQASVNVVSGSHTISAPTNFVSDASIAVTPVNSTLTMSGGVMGADASIAKLGAGTLQARNVRTRELHVNEGKVQILASGADAATSVVNALSIAVGAQLDLTNNKLIIDYTTLGTMLSDLASEVSDGRLFSSLADSTHSIGYGDNGTLGKSSFGGVSVDGTSLLAAYTLIGDANLDGAVDGADLAALSSAWNSGTGVWDNGDFNYDGFVNVGDLKLLASNWMQGSTASPLSLDLMLAAFGLPADAVPEPAVVGLLGAGLFMAGISRRRARKAPASL